MVYVISSFSFLKKVSVSMRYKGYLIDLDGTMYKGNEPIDGAKQFIDYLNDENIPYVFITNNSTLPREAVVEKLGSFGITTTIEHVLTSATATANYIKAEKANARCYVIGEAGLQQAFHDASITMTDVDCDYVVVGLDRNITYEKLSKACLLIRNGATFLSTNKDAAIPTEKGLVPGNGALTASIAVSTGVEPVFIGKPEKTMADEALKLIGMDCANVLMIGDNYETDISFGIRANIDTLMVLTGFSKVSSLENVAEKPTYVRANLIEWMKENGLGVW